MRDDLRRELGDVAADVIDLLKTRYELMVLQALDQDQGTFHARLEARRHKTFQQIKNMGDDFAPNENENQIKRLAMLVLDDSFGMFADLLDPDRPELPPGL